MPPLIAEFSALTRFVGNVLSVNTSLVLPWLLTAGVAAADSPPDTVPEQNIPSVECVSPRIPARAFVAEDDVNYLKKQANAYAACMQKYIDERQAQIRVYGQRQQAEAEAANAAIKALNDYFARVKAFASQHEPKG